MMNETALHIDLFHDTVCPWCRIGKEHLRLALADWPGAPVSVTYRAFFLNPDIPAGGYDFHTYMRAKGGGRIPLEQFFAAPRQMGARVGLTFNFETISRAPNSLLSHRLIALTPAARREAMIDALYTAYFEQGHDIGDRATLAGLAGELGLDEATIADQLADDAAAEAVLAEAAWAQQLGINGVPFFLINGRYGFSGAHPPEAIRRLLNQIATTPPPPDP